MEKNLSAVMSVFLWLWLLALVTGDRWQVRGDRWHMTCDLWHVTHETWQMRHYAWKMKKDKLKMLNFLQTYWYCCIHPHTLRDNVSPIIMICIDWLSELVLLLVHYNKQFYFSFKKLDLKSIRKKIKNKYIIINA